MSTRCVYDPRRLVPAGSGIQIARTINWPVAHRSLFRLGRDSQLVLVLRHDKPYIFETQFDMDPGEVVDFNESERLTRVHRDIISPIRMTCSGSRLLVAIALRFTMIERAIAGRTYRA